MRKVRDICAAFHKEDLGERGNLSSLTMEHEATFFLTFSSFKAILNKKDEHYCSSLNYSLLIFDIFEYVRNQKLILLTLKALPNFNLLKNMHIPVGLLQKTKHTICKYNF